MECRQTSQSRCDSCCVSVTLLTRTTSQPSLRSCCHHCQAAPVALQDHMNCFTWDNSPAATIEKIRKGVARAMQDPAVIDKLRKSYVAQTPETREKMRKKIQLRYGIQLHKQAFGARSKNSNSVATTGVAVFHCHIGCSALVGFRRVGWRRSTVFQKRPASRKVRRKMSPEELEVRCMVCFEFGSVVSSAGIEIQMFLMQCNKNIVI